MNMPRIYAVEKKMADCNTRMDSLETRMDMLQQKQKIFDEQHADEHDELFSLPLPAQPAFQPSAPATLTAGLADGAPLFTEGAGSQYGSGAKLGTPPDSDHPKMIHKDWPGIPVPIDHDPSWGQSLLGTPVQTPRRGRSQERTSPTGRSPLQPDEESIWGREYLVFQKRVPTSRRSTMHSRTVCRPWEPSSKTSALEGLASATTSTRSPNTPRTSKTQSRPTVRLHSNPSTNQSRMKSLQRHSTRRSVSSKTS